MAKLTVPINIEGLGFAIDIIRAFVDCCEFENNVSKEYKKGFYDFGNAVVKALEKMENEHGADVVPIVRCKDCKHYEMGVCLKIYSDGNANKDAWQNRKPKDFCNYGERRTGNEQ